jgi:hypothetical protein
MDIDDRIARAKDLIQKREEIDAELAGLFGIAIKAKKTLRCSKCGDEGHNAKTCPSQQHQLALGYPVSKNRKIDHARRTIHPRRLAYACNVLPDNALANKLGVDGNDHLFAKYEKRSQDFSGVVFNSVSPTGLSGGALIDLGGGDLLKPTKLPRHPFRPCRSTHRDSSQREAHDRRQDGSGSARAST